MFIDEALNLAYAYAKEKCVESDLNIITKELLSISGKKKHLFEEVKASSYEYQSTQGMLAKLNERESIRKSKGVYYTPSDVVHFIVTNSIKSAFGKLTPENIGDEDLSDIPFRSFATKKTVFDPTCGAGEYLLAALELKFDLLEKHYKKIPKDVVETAVSTIFGNDINIESVVIAKLRILLCVLERYGANYCTGLSNPMKKQFFTYDYVQEDPKRRKYDIIVGNPPYVEDFKSGLVLKKRYGNIFANVLMNAAKQLSTNGSFGFIIPLSYISTPRMAALRDELIKNIPEQYILSYSDRPDCLSFCIPDIIIYDEEKPVAVIDAKYKMSGRPDRSDSHQLLAYVLLTGANRCGFILPGQKTEVKEMVSSGDNYLPLAPHLLRYYELLLGSNSDSEELKKVLQ